MSIAGSSRLSNMVITADRSVELFWMRPWNAFKALFLINRYAAVLTISIYTLQYLVKDVSTTVCYGLLWSGWVGSIVLITVLNLAILSRVVALWSRSRVVKAVALILALTNIIAFTISVIRLWGTASVKPQIWPFTGCSAIPRIIDIKINLIVIPAFAFETYAVVLTFVKVYRMAKEAGVQLPILTVLLSDGIVYYIAIIISQALTFVSCYHKNISMLLPVVIVSAIACNRLFIRLQEVLVGGEVVVFDALRGSALSEPMWGDIRLPPIVFAERGRPSQRRVSTQWSDI
ncbi:hypothetical protein CPB86DRAFT_872126 [Serendipita vermifera]|nr:hypothetical protein CPB86DRAFT_872126 [Serendipita vermifera]